MALPAGNIPQGSDAGNRAHLMMRGQLKQAMMRITGLRRLRGKQRGVSLIEVLLGIVIILVASIGTLTYFAYGFGNIGKQGNRRAAVERARQRLEQLMAAKFSELPPFDGQLYWCSGGDPCDPASWVASAVPVAQTVAVDDLQTQRMETTVQFIDDPTTGTLTLDTLELGVRVWFMPGVAPPDDHFHRIYLRTLRTP